MNMAPHDMPQSHVVPYGDTPVYLDKVKPLDPNLFSLSEEAATFFKASTGINDDEELKKHILITQEMAYRVKLFEHYNFCITDCQLARSHRILVSTDSDI